MTKIIEATRYFVEGHDAVFTTREEAERFAREAAFDEKFQALDHLRFNNAGELRKWLNQYYEDIIDLTGWKVDTMGETGDA